VRLHLSPFHFIPHPPLIIIYSIIPQFTLPTPKKRTQVLSPWSLNYSSHNLSLRSLAKMSTTTTITTTLRQSLCGADPTTTDPTKIPCERDSSSPKEGENEVGDENFLTANHGVTGREPNTNPPNWWTDHRRMPPHRPPVVHSEWVTIGGSLPMRIFLWNMFSACQLLRVRNGIESA
jgi:hypothetical protein